VNRERGSTCAPAALLSLLFLTVVAAAPPGQEPAASAQRVSTMTAKVDRVDRFGRMLTVRTEDGQIQTVSVDPAVKLFDEIKTGDTLRIHFVESVVVAVRPNAKPSSIVDTTAAAKKARGDQGTDVLQQFKVVVTIESVDPRTQMVVYKDGDGRTVNRLVSDPKLLEGLKRGDIVELTYSRERAIEIERR
jgi:Cu/Ag efflux protein CusF